MQELERTDRVIATRDAAREERDGVHDRRDLARWLALGAVNAYISSMSWFPKPVGPRAALADLRAFMRQGRREQVIGAALAILVTAIIVIEFLVDSKINTAPPPQIVYAQSWKADRTDAEIVAQQRIDQAKRDEAAREKQRQFQKLEKQLGM